MTQDNKPVETIAEVSPLPPTHPGYSVSIQTVERDGEVDEYRFGKFGKLKFQSGKVSPANPVNGIFVEHLIALGIMRLTAYQHGQHPCNENQHTINALNVALDWQKRRRSSASLGE